MYVSTQWVKGIYTQTKKKRPIFMVLYLSIQLRCCNKNKTKIFIKRLTHKNNKYLVFSSDLEELLNLMCTQLFPISSGSYSSKRDTFYVKLQTEASDDEKKYKISSLLIERAKSQFQIFHLRS